MMADSEDIYACINRAAYFDDVGCKKWGLHSMRSTSTGAAVIALIAWGLGLMFGSQAALVALRIGPLPCCVTPTPQPLNAVFFLAMPVLGLILSLCLLRLARRSNDHLTVIIASIVTLIYATPFTLIACLSGPVPL